MSELTPLPPDNPPDVSLLLGDLRRLIHEARPAHVFNLAQGVRGWLRLQAAALKQNDAQPGAGQFPDDGGTCWPAANDADVRLERHPRPQCEMTQGQTCALAIREI